MDHRTTSTPIAAPRGFGRPSIEVFADIVCPFTHVGLRWFAHRRTELGHHGTALWVRSWPLEIINGAPLDPEVTAEKIRVLRAQVAPALFAGFRPDSFPATSLPALALAAAAYESDLALGERVSLELRDLLFEEGEDIAAPDVLASVAGQHDLTVGPRHHQVVLDDLAEGEGRGVVGSPSFFTASGCFFCPALDISHDAEGHLLVTPDQAGFGRFVEACFSPTG